MDDIYVLKYSATVLCFIYYFKYYFTDRCSYYFCLLRDCLSTVYIYIVYIVLLCIIYTCMMMYRSMMMMYDVVHILYIL